MIFIHSVDQLLLRKAFLQHSLSQRIIANTQTVDIVFTHILENLKNAGLIIVHGFSLLSFLHNTLLGFFHQIEAFCNIVP